MRRDMVIIGLLITSGIAILIIGMSTHGGRGEATRTPNRSAWAISLFRSRLDPGLLETREKGMGLGTRPLGETSKTLCGLDSWILGAKKGRLGLGARTLGV
jgi:hypothetical protein